jgi:hypothetical protein
MPIHENTPKERLLTCQKTTNQLKTSPSALIQLWIQNNILSKVPAFLCRQIAFDCFSRHSIIFSNVPGPSYPLTFCNETILGLQAIFPNLLNQSIIISYNEDVYFNLCVNPEIIDESDKLKEFYLEELIELAKSYNIDCEKKDILSNLQL